MDRISLADGLSVEKLGDVYLFYGDDGVEVARCITSDLAEGIIDHWVDDIRPRQRALRRFRCWGREEVDCGDDYLSPDMTIEEFTQWMERHSDEFVNVIDNYLMEMMEQDFYIRIVVTHEGKGPEIVDQWTHRVLQTSHFDPDGTRQNRIKMNYVYGRLFDKLVRLMAGYGSVDRFTIKLGVRRG